MPPASAAKRDQTAALRQLTDNVPAMILHLDRELYCRFANRRDVEFFGFDSDSLVGKPVREIIGDAADREVERYFTQVLAGRPVSYQWIVHQQNCEPRQTRLPGAGLALSRPRQVHADQGRPGARCR